MLNSTQMIVIYKVKQLGFDIQTVENVKKYFNEDLNKHEEKDVKALVTFIEETLVTS